LRIDRVLAKDTFWQSHRATACYPKQIKVLNRLLDGGEEMLRERDQLRPVFRAVAKVSKAKPPRAPD